MLLPDRGDGLPDLHGAAQAWDVRGRADLYFHFAPDGLARIDAHYEFAAQDTPARILLNHGIFRRHGVHKPAHSSTWGYQDQHTRLTYHLSEAPLRPGYVQSSFSWGYRAVYPAE